MTFPPGPDHLERKSLLEWFSRDQLGLMDFCFENYGDLFTLDLGDFGNGVGHDVNGKWVFLCNSEDMRTMFSAKDEVLHGGEANVILFGPTDYWGILRLDEKPHTARRKLIQPIFNGKRLDNTYVETMRSAVERVVRTWELDKDIVILDEMQKITIDIIVQTIFGITDDLTKEELCGKLLKVERAELSREEILGVEAELGNILDEEIARYRKNPELLEGREDVFAHLMLAKFEGVGLRDEEIRCELVSLLKAGFGTTANSLAWVFECMLRYPEKASIVFTEIEGKYPICKEHMSELPFVDAFVKEAMRLRPLCAIVGPRLVKEPFQLGRYSLPKGTMLANCSYLIHRNPAVFEKPLEFEPERFLNSKVTTYQFTPFGGGTRMCLGRAFGLLEMKVVLSVVFQELSQRNYQMVSVIADPKPEKQFFFIAPEKGLPVVLKLT